MSTFSQLMAISRTQTEQVQSTVEAAKAQRQRKEELRRKQQEERERHERELEAKLRAEHFEKQKKERERLKRLEQERSAKELELARREEQQREALMHGPNRKKAASSIASDDSAPQWPSSSRRSRDEVRRARLPLDDDRDSRSGSPSLALTREEKRQRKLEADLRRSLGVGKRTPPKNVRRNGRLPGGALDVTATASQSSADTPPSSQSVKARIAAIPNTLTKLNVVKRDTRTIDEILQDRAKARDCKVLDGDQAREFNDWFGSSKKKDTNGTTVSPPAPNSGANTPTSQSSSNRGTPSAPAHKADGPKSAAAAAKLASVVSHRALLKVPVSQKDADGRTIPSRSSSGSRQLNPGSTSISTSLRASSSSISEKRPRSPSLSPSPPPSSKKRNLSPPSKTNAISNEIWKLFGKDRSAYVQKDVLSDDDDMEAGARDLWREESRSARFAKKEDFEEMEAEKRHEEEKRRRRKERDRLETRAPTH